MRAFVAIKVADGVRKRILDVQEALRRAGADVKWVEEGNLHLTLKFLGEIGEEQAGELKRLLSAEAPRWPKMELTYAGAGTFPEGGVPRVVWAGCTGDVARLAGLAGAAERAAGRIGVPRERRPFVAHLTIGRVRSARNAKGLRAAVENQREVPLGKDTVTEFVLFESTLTPEGPIYQVRATFPLAGQGLL